jgi:hypothetical protein
MGNRKGKVLLAAVFLFSLYLSVGVLQTTSQPQKERLGRVYLSVFMFVWSGECGCGCGCVNVNENSHLFRRSF